MSETKVPRIAETVEAIHSALAKDCADRIEAGMRQREGEGVQIPGYTRSEAVLASYTEEVVRALAHRASRRNESDGYTYAVDYYDAVMEAAQDLGLIR